MSFLDFLRLYPREFPICFKMEARVEALVERPFRQCTKEFLSTSIKRPKSSRWLRAVQKWLGKSFHERSPAESIGEIAWVIRQGR